MNWQKKYVLFLLSCLMFGTAVFIQFSSTKANIQGESTHFLYLPIILYELDYRYELINKEHRLYCDDQHFLTLVSEDETFNLRPHPGIDINGWGSSWYMQPFFPGANLKHTAEPKITATDYGIQIEAEGKVSLNDNDTYGSWTVSMFFRCHPGNKQITGDGAYQITLDDSINNQGDLNLYRIASNYLIDVPLLSGGNGNTGDMETVIYSYDGYIDNGWTPKINPPGHFPGDESDYLSVEIVGVCNEVDTAAQGYAPIQAAAKPSLKVILSSQTIGSRMRFGAFFEPDDSQKFWLDNVGITPLIPANSTETVFAFDVLFESTAIGNDGQMPCWNP
ncbi:MAG: hypothetical protein GY805_39605 [Chloroflexi bacterium]|nr:hypothetical protein [Chloroflexota bacterium]